MYSVFRYDPPSVGFAALSSTADAESDNLNGAVPSPTLGSSSSQVTAKSAACRSAPPARWGAAGALALAGVLLGLGGVW